MLGSGDPGGPAGALPGSGWCDRGPMDAIARNEAVATSGAVVASYSLAIAGGTGLHEGDGCEAIRHPLSFKSTSSSVSYITFS